MTFGGGGVVLIKMHREENEGGDMHILTEKRETLPLMSGFTTDHWVTEITALLFNSMEIDRYYFNELSL